MTGRGPQRPQATKGPQHRKWQTGVWKTCSDLCALGNAHETTWQQGLTCQDGIDPKRALVRTRRKGLLYAGMGKTLGQLGWAVGRRRLRKIETGAAVCPAMPMHGTHPRNNGQRAEERPHCPSQDRKSIWPPGVKGQAGNGGCGQKEYHLFIKTKRPCQMWQSG